MKDAGANGGEMNHLLTVDDGAVELCRSRLDDETILGVLQEHRQPGGVAPLPQLGGGRQDGVGVGGQGGGGAWGWVSDILALVSV